MSDPEVEKILKKAERVLLFPLFFNYFFDLAF